MNRCFLPIAVALLAGISNLTAAASGATPPARPNVLVILADDLGHGDVGAFFKGPRRSGPAGGAMTPQLDRLAEQGARLTHHYCAAPVCAPSRASLLSGLHQGHANVRNNQFDKALADDHTLATVLKRAGYATAAFGKWGLQGQAPGGPPNWPAHPLNRGFDYYFGYIRHADGHEHYPKEAPYRNRDNTAKKQGANANAGGDRPSRFGKEVWENRREISDTLDKCYTTDLFTARAKRWIVDQHRAAPGEPFFAYLAFDTPHAVLELPTMAYPAGGGVEGGLQWLGTPGRMITTAGGHIDSWTHPEFAAATYDHDGDAATPPQLWPEVFQRYATSVRRIDEAVADLVHLLRDLGIADNTLIVFSSDNGPSLESYLPEPFSPEFFGGFEPFEGVKRDLWEGGTRVPTIAWWPARIRSGTTVAAPSAQWDWLPTFAEAAGLPAPAKADGVSLLPALAGGELDRRRAPLYFEYSVTGRTPDFPAFDSQRRQRARREMQALRVGDTVAVRYDIKSPDDDFEIYNVVTDPRQRHNLANESAATQARFKALALQSRRADASAPRPYDAALVPALPSLVGKRAEVRWAVFPGEFPWVPATAGMKPVRTGVSAALDPAAVMPAAQPGAIAFEGVLEVPRDGEYTFACATDTGVVVRLHDATLLACDQGYTGGSEQRTSIRLQAGRHPLRITYWTRGGVTPALTVTWSGPELTASPVAAALYHD